MNNLSSIAEFMGIDKQQSREKDILFEKCMDESLSLSLLSVLVSLISSFLSCIQLYRFSPLILDFFLII